MPATRRDRPWISVAAASATGHGDRRDDDREPDRERQRIEELRVGPEPDRVVAQGDEGPVAVEAELDAEQAQAEHGQHRRHDEQADQEQPRGRENGGEPPVRKPVEPRVQPDPTAPRAGSGARARGHGSGPSAHAFQRVDSVPSASLSYGGGEGVSRILSTTG